jgi:thiol-disulfide isomerase/thioredoxin
MAFAVVVALGIGAGAITLLGHRHTAAHTAVPRQTTSPSTQLPAPIHGLQGHPIVITVWASWCAPCRSDLSLVASVASRYGPRVAFIAADYKDVQRLARAYLREHHIALPNYPAVHLHPVVPTDLQGVPTTIFVNSAGRVTGIHPEAYRSASALADDVAAYARFGPSTHPSPSGTA